MATECEIDRLSALPDHIMTCNIFSHLTLRDVLRTSALSSRWRFLWKTIPNLDFSFQLFDFVVGIESINDTIDNILLLHSGQIERFSILDFFWLEYIELKRLHVEQWIHHAALKEVKQMSLTICSAKLDIPPSLFACHLLTDLELHNFRFTGITTEFSGFPFLQSFSLSAMDGFSDDELKQFIGLCPLLRKLVLSHCEQLINLKIQAPNLNSLSIEYCSPTELLIEACPQLVELEINFFTQLIHLKIQAPNLNSLNIIDCHYMESLTADCPQLVELEIESCDRLIEFKMNSCVLFHYLHNLDVQVPKELPMLNSLRKLSVKDCYTVSDLALLTVLGCFSNLEEVQVSTNIKICEEQEKAKGEVVADSTFQGLKKVYVDISSAMKKEEAVMVAFLLNNAPSLNTITLTLPYCPANIHDKEFINKVLDLQQIDEKVNIEMKIDKERVDVTCRYNFDYGDNICRSDYLVSDHSGSDENLQN